MSNTIHPTAIIEAGAQLAADVTVGAYAYIGSRVKMAAGCVVAHHASVDGNTTLGVNNTIHPYAYIGGKTQDLKYKGGNPALLIGDNNNFREYATVHCGTTEETPTVIGSHNHFLAYTHVAHECQVGSHNIFSNAASLAGHVTIHDHVVFGGMAGAHQFVRVGSYAMVGAMSKLVKDVPPFMMVDGNPAVLANFNKIGLERNGFTTEEIEDAFRAFKIFFRGHTFENIPTYLEQKLTPGGRICLELSEFLKNSKRGITTSR